MAQLHKRFSDEQIIFLFQAYEQGLMTREEIQDTLEISRSRFFVLWKEYLVQSDSKIIFCLFSQFFIAPTIHTLQNFQCNQTFDRALELGFLRCTANVSVAI